MRIKDIGGEFGLIARVARRIKDKSVANQIGDDTAVVRVGGKTLLFTIDTLVEDDHFALRWSTPEHIGAKAMESNVSDIAANGGRPRYALVSICLKDETPVEFVDGLYKGIYSVADKYGFEIIGGNFTHGKQIVIDVAMVGETQKPVLRSGAREGDLICATGDLGKSKAGLELFRHFGNGAKRFGAVKAHLEPKCRLNESMIIAKFASAMIDVSDGLAPEVGHICESSGVGAVVYKEKIPVSKSTRSAAELLKADAYDFALRGGEDYELVFTISQKNLTKLKAKFKAFAVVGKILPQKSGIYLLENGKKKSLGKGYDHFV
ncbi:MAG: thiamine-phosphate kinase [Candidatus Aenigmarchaeota archaeon]|nr:thiamine-phosphate kinase [Candidatus Aenigmarchaeota archaeon]